MSNRNRIDRRCFTTFFALAALLAGCSSGSGGGGGGGGGSTSISTSTSISSSSAGSGGGVSSGAGSGGAASSSVGAGGAGGIGGSSASAGSSSGGASSSSSSGSSSSSTGGGVVGPYDSCGLCASGQLLVNGRCIQIAGDPAQGCTEDAYVIAHQWSGISPACKTATGRLAPHCSGGACVDGACRPGHMDCNGDAADGCEADLRTRQTCGSCAVACAANQFCRLGACVAACAPLEIQAPNGQCVDTTTCDTASCAAPLHATPVCVANACSVLCDAGFTACSGACVDTQTSVTTCGGCATACPKPPEGGAMACVAGVCQKSCPAGLTLCGNTCTDLATDLVSCGACGVPCSTGLCVGGICDAALPRVLVPSATFTALELDLTTVFYASGTTIGRVEKTGGPTTTLVSGETNIGGIAIDSSYVYWSSPSTNTIRRVLKTGGAEAVVAAATNPGTLAVDATDVYWANITNVSILKAPKAGGGATSVVVPMVSATFLALDDVYVYYFNGFMINGGYRAHKDGSGVPQLVDGFTRSNFVFDQDYVYASISEPNYDLMRVRRDFSAPERKALVGKGATFFTAVKSIGVGKNFVYFRDAQNFQVPSGKALKCGGAIVTGVVVPPAFASDLYGSPMVLDDSFVYSVLGGQLVRTPQ